MNKSLKLSDFENIFEKTRVGIYIYNREEGLIFINKSLLEFLKLSRESIIGFNFLKLMGDKDKTDIIKYANLAFDGDMEDVPYPITINFNGKNGLTTLEFYPEILTIDNSKFIVGFAFNLVENKDLKEILSGKVIEGDNKRVASLLVKFNNLLTGIMGYTSLLKLRERRKEEFEIIEKIYDTTLDASNIVGSLLHQMEKSEQGEGAFLIVDEDDSSSSLISKVLAEEGYSILMPNKNNIIDETMKVIDRIAGIFVDIYVPGMSTFGYVSEVLNRRKNLKIVLMAHRKALEDVKDILDIHDVYFLQKPVDEKKVKNLIKLMKRS